MTATTTPPVPRPPRPAPAPQLFVEPLELPASTDPVCALCDARRSQHDVVGCGTFIRDHGR